MNVRRICGRIRLLPTGVAGCGCVNRPVSLYEERSTRVPVCLRCFAWRSGRCGCPAAACGAGGRGCNAAAALQMQLLCSLDTLLNSYRGGSAAAASSLRCTSEQGPRWRLVIGSSDTVRRAGPPSAGRRLSCRRRQCCRQGCCAGGAGRRARRRPGRRRRPGWTPGCRNPPGGWTAADEGPPPQPAPAPFPAWSLSPAHV